MKGISIENYARGENAHLVTIGDVELFFSYKTLIGFKANGETVTRDNQWGKTTGAHLCKIPGDRREHRVDEKTFAEKWNKLVGWPIPS